MALVTDNQIIIICVFTYILLVYLNYVGYKNRQEVVNKPVLLVVLLIIFVGLLPLGLTIAASFWALRQLVSLFLTMRHGSSFGGLFSGHDGIHLLKSADRFAVSALMIVEYDVEKHRADFYTYMTRALRETLANGLGGDVKILGVFRRCLGYSYLIKNKRTFQDCCRKLKRLDSLSDEIDRKDLMNIIGEHSSDLLPSNGAGLWEMLIGTQRLKQDEKNCYPIVIRFNHSLMDGESFVNLILTYFAKRENQTEDLRIPTVTLLQRLRLTIKIFLLNFAIICCLPAFFVAYLYRLLYQFDFSNRPKLHNKMVVSFKTDKTPRYIKIINEIKNNVKGSTFTEIILTAFIASLQTWLQKNSFAVPKFISVGITSQPAISKIKKLEGFQADVTLGNRFTLYYPILPLNITNEKESSTSPSKRLQLVKHQVQLIGNSLDKEVTYWLLNIFGGVFPSWLTEIFSELFTTGLFFTNMPGIHPVTVFRGCPLREFVAFLPHRDRTGMALYFATYAQRVQLGLSVDAALISDREEVDEILNGVYTHLDLLHNEVTGSQGGL